jgi:siroheme decarboxylase
VNPLPLSLLKAMEANLPCEPRPFLRLAQRFGLTEDELLRTLRECLDSGMIRRYGARIKHQEAGFSANVMVVWQVSEDDVDRVAASMVPHPAISHCYERPAFPGFPYNFYTMIHGRSRAECEAVISQLSSQSGVTAYRALWSVKEFKKATPCYSELLAQTEPEMKERNAT